jgi:hypothetical protein
MSEIMKASEQRWRKLTAAEVYEESAQP